MTAVYTVPEICALMNVSRETVYRWLRTGELRSLKVGGLRRITEDQLNEFLASKEEESQVARLKTS